MLIDGGCMHNIFKNLCKQTLIFVVVVLFGQSIIAQTISVTQKKANEVKHPQVSASTIGFDVTTQREVSTAVAPLLNFKGMSKVVTGGNILWDKTHGVYSSYEPSGDYSSLSTLLSGLGFTMTTTTAGVNNVNLASYNVVVVCLGSNWNTVYTTAEISALNTFVQNGGGLLILGDNTGCPNANINPLAQQFGITLGVSNISDYLTNLQSGHPVYSGVDTVYMLAAGELTVTSSATLIARDVSAKGAIAVAQAGSGRVLAGGDINLWTNGYITNADNKIFAANVFNWLNTGGTSSTAHITVTPSSFDVSLLQGDSTTRTLTIGNTGTSSLTWSINNLITTPIVSDQLQSSQSFSNINWSQSTTLAAGSQISHRTQIVDLPSEITNSSSLSGGKILLLTGNDSGNWIHFKSALVSTGLFSYSDFDTLNNPSTLTAANLQPYSAVIVWTNGNFSNPQMVGDTLKKYVDGGG